MQDGEGNKPIFLGVKYQGLELNFVNVLVNTSVLTL